LHVDSRPVSIPLNQVSNKTVDCRIEMWFKFGRI
jgi:hypothetical protein